MIPFLSLKAQTDALREEILAALGTVIDAQDFANGSAVATFEKALSAYVGCRDAIGVSTPTSASR